MLVVCVVLCVNLCAHTQGCGRGSNGRGLRGEVGKIGVKKGAERKDGKMVVQCECEWLFVSFLLCKHLCV